ncbi:hypothetical protein KIL84_004825 [Mauremys mutica]|uniref:Uncharacterized protein n=1 Tax=Mauremys mutica TaxID=74926 RepID=A0A9D3XNT4_9SAUR|nr:hypothetical protein KIL84_004825 [Mauremys mutica]
MCLLKEAANARALAEESGALNDAMQAGCAPFCQSVRRALDSFLFSSGSSCTKQAISPRHPTPEVAMVEGHHGLEVRHSNSQRRGQEHLSPKCIHLPVLSIHRGRVTLPRSELLLAAATPANLVQDGCGNERNFPVEPDTVCPLS